MKSRHGFALLEVILLVIIAAIIAVIGCIAYSRLSVKADRTHHPKE